MHLYLVWGEVFPLLWDWVGEGEEGGERVWEGEQSGEMARERERGRGERVSGVVVW